MGAVTLKRALVSVLLGAAVLAPAAAAKTITVNTATALTPGSGGVTIARTFTGGVFTNLSTGKKVVRTPPREMYVVTSGPVGGVSTKVSCYPSASSYWPKVNRGAAAGPGRVGLMYDQGSASCTVTASASEAYKKSGTIKIALQIVP